MKIKEIFSLSLTGLLIICAIIITGLVIRKELFPPELHPRERQINNWQQLIIRGQQVDTANAEVLIAEFFDYQCPYCRLVQPALKAIQEKYSENISVIRIHLPLTGHEYAYTAAMAAECARLQGAFESYHDLLFIHQDNLRNQPYDSLAMYAGIKNISSFSRCLKNEQTAQIVEADLTLADDLGITSVPTFMVNGTLVSGALSKERLDHLVQESLYKLPDK